MIYELEFTEEALADIASLKKSEKAAFIKLQKLLIELMEHPHTGTGQIELLKHQLTGLYSRRISPKHRLIYSVNDEKVNVLVISAYGHYGNK